MGGDTDSSSSSGEEDGNAEWRAAIDSVAAASSTANGVTAADANPKNRSAPNHEDEDLKPPKLKHYQVKAQKLLDELLEKSIELAREDTNSVLLEDPGTEEGEILLFKHAPPGVVFDYVDELQQPRKKLRLVRGQEIDEKSEKFRCQLQSVVVDGLDIIAAARDACQKALTKLEAKDAAAKAAAKREEERVAELKRIKGERWLPSMAREMRSRNKQ